MKKNAIKIICCFVIFSVVVILVEMLLNCEFFELSSQISIIDVFSLLTTIVAICVAIYVADKLEKDVQNDQIEKELYLAKITEVEQLLKELETQIENGRITYGKIVNRVHLCRIKKNHIFNNINNNKRFKVEKITVFEKSVSIDMSSLKRLLTETSIHQEGNHDVSIKRDIVTYSDKRIIEIFTKINTINENFFNMKILINYL